LMRVHTENLAGPGPLTQSPVPIPWDVAGIAIVLSPLIAMLAALWPADRAVNVNPADAMRAEGSTGFLKPAPHLGPTGLRGLILRLPLSAKLSAAFGLIFILATTALTIVRVDYERRLLEDNIRALMESSGHQLTNFFREQLPAAVTELNAQTLAAIEQQAAAQTEFLQTRIGEGQYAFELKYFFVLDTQGNVVRTDHPEFLGRTLTQTIQLGGSGAIARLTDWSGVPVFEAAIPIENQAGRRVGQIQIGLSRNPVNQFLNDVINASLITTLAAVLVTITLTVWLTRRALSPVKQLAEASQAVARGDLTQRVPETQWDEVGALARSFNEMVAGLNERERMRDLFGRYLSREVSEAVLKGRVTFRGERKTITVLYCDMRGSTAFAEQHAPEEVMAALNEYFEVVILAVEAQGGIVNRFVGDETVCVFGAPTEYHDHADRAMQAALGIRAGFAYLNEKRSRLNLPTLRFGIGINTGEVVAGATGSEERQEYTLIGDAMNVGARIEQLNKAFSDQDILLSEFTRSALAGPGRKAGAYDLIDLGEVEVRGKSQPVRVWGVGGR
jgi:class 3 adenylate cyclase